MVLHVASNSRVLLCQVYQPAAQLAVVTAFMPMRMTDTYTYELHQWACCHLANSCEGIALPMRACHFVDTARASDNALGLSGAQRGDVQ